MPRLNDTEKALLRSQSGPLSGAPLSTAPTCFHTRIESHLFRLLLLRRLRLPLPTCVPVCRCGRPLDSFGHHRAACPRAVCLRDVASRWRWPQPMCAVKLMHGSRPTSWSVTWTLLCPTPALDGRRLEVVAERLSLFGWVQLALDTTLVSPIHAEGTARPGAAQRDGVALVSARRLKERTYPELVGRGARARLVVLPGEVGGPWSGETSNFLRLRAESGVCLEGQVGCDLVLRCRTGARLLVPEPSWRARCRW